MNFKKIALAAAVAAVCSQSAFAYGGGSASNELVYGKYDAGYRFEEILEEIEADDFDTMAIVGAINDATINASVNITGEQIKLGSSDTAAAASATVSTVDGAAEAVANAVSGNIFKTVAVGAMNEAVLTVTADTSLSSTLNGDIETSGFGLSGFGPSGDFEAPDRETAVVSLSINAGAIDGSVNIAAAIDLNRDTGWFLNEVAQPVASLDLSNISISTTAVGAMNNTTATVSNTSSSLTQTNIRMVSTPTPWIPTPDGL